ncbi:hypothetical protein S40288_11091 [Stachybotrys chartarum IBT 40288]|nr:hypothetical protein S40288_11091 [Stachybotrys chartarum IBT 40288]
MSPDFKDFSFYKETHLSEEEVPDPLGFFHKYGVFYQEDKNIGDEALNLQKKSLERELSDEDFKEAQSSMLENEGG